MSELIDRQAAIDAVMECYDNDELFEVYEWKLNELPPIQPKRGRWIGKYPVTSVCSECGFLIHDSKVKVFAFCPNCGAKMEVNNDR